MFLKTLEIFGFKSFADKVKIEFTDGVAALLGPNGCGKSNVVDAMKWVLGEQSSKSLRAESMNDVIFAGSDSRKPVNVCEVTLTVSNQDEVLPLNLPEISIRRRLYRSGESEYFINGNLVKLREVRELFFDTGIGKSAYSIMEQGKIDQLLSTKPEERRSVFEEAAGITRFRVRGQEAERKLEKTEENMRHVEGILDEVRRSYNSLKVQAEKAEAYRKLREEIFEVELEIQLLRLKGLLEDKKKREGRLGDKEKARDEIQRSIDAGNASIAQQADLVNSMESQLVETHKKLYQLDMEKNTRENQIRMYRERIGELERSIEADQVREKNVTRKLAGDRGRQRTQADGPRGPGSQDRGDRREHRGVHPGHRRLRRTSKGATKRPSGTTGRPSSGLEVQHRRASHRAARHHGRHRHAAGCPTRRRWATPPRSGRRLKQSIAEALQSLRIQLGGKMSILEDASRVESVSRAERDKIVQNTISVLKASLEKLSTLEQLFSKYRAFAPSFLDEFLAPQGIITRKRDIDERINETAGAASRAAPAERAACP